MFFRRIPLLAIIYEGEPWAVQVEDGLSVQRVYFPVRLRIHFATVMSLSLTAIVLSTDKNGAKASTYNLNLTKQCVKAG